MPFLNRIVIIVPLLLMHILGNAQNKSDTIHWRPDYKLKWGDFMGALDTRGRYAAACSANFSYSYRYTRSGYIFAVHAYFDKKLSWANKALVNDRNLIHEQGHFDICEIHAINLSCVLNRIEVNANNISKKSQGICDSIAAQMDLMNELYDKETLHGTNHKKQAEWNKKIQLMLEKRGN